MSLIVTPGLLWTATTIFPVLCTAIVVLRFVARRLQRVRSGWDDWLTVPALILVWGMAIDIMIGTGQQAVGYPTPAATPEAPEPWQEPIVRKVYWSVTLLQITALAFIKISCMLFLGRIFRTGADRIFDAFFWGYIAVTVCWWISFFFGYLFTCGTHISVNWGTAADQVVCPANFVQVNSGMSILDLILDVLIMIFPIPYIWRLNLNTTRKLLVSFIFLLGSMAVLASIARLVIIELEMNVIFDMTTDQDLIATAVIYFMYLEACFGLLSTSLPSLSGLTKHKSVQHLVAGLTSMISSLSGSSRGSRGSSKKESQGSEPVSNKMVSSSHGGSSHSETEIGGPSDAWVTHTGHSDIEMSPHVPENAIKKSQGWETTRE